MARFSAWVISPLQRVICYLQQSLLDVNSFSGWVVSPLQRVGSSGMNCAVSCKGRTGAAPAVEMNPRQASFFLG